MQGLSTCCVQQRFSVIRCCESNDKKSRRRKTREERRTMVESFINKYRKSNHGKFPSLNLTHKEVGGSFYIVREIVRDIIQENRVLGPGGPNMKVLTLQDCLEEHEIEYFDLPESELSESSTGSTADEMQKETSILPNRSNHNSLLVKPDSDELNASEQNNFMISDVSYNGSNYLLQSFCGKDEPESLFEIEPEEMNLRKTSLHTENSEEDSSVFQHVLGIYNKHNVDQINPLPETSSISAHGLVMNEDVMGECDSLSLSGSMSKENNGIHDNIVLDTVPEENVSVSTLTPSNHLLNNQDSLEEEHASFISSVSNTGSALVFFGNDELSVNTQSLSNEQGDSDMQIDKVFVSHGAEVTENSFSSLGDVVSKTTLSVSPSSPPPFSSTLLTEVAPAPQDYDMDSLSQKIECAAGPLSPSTQMTSMLPPKADHETNTNSLTDNGSCSSSKPANGNEDVQSENNSVWTAIKAFVNAFIKFWSE